LSTAKVVRIDERRGARWITLDRPDSRNALSRRMVDELRAAVGESHHARLVVFTGAGDKAFCAGADLKERRGMTHGDTRQFLDDLNALMNEIAALPSLTLAAVNGAAFGGGCELALACDLRAMVPSAHIGLTETTLGIIPGAGGTQRLARLVGAGRAKELIALGRRLSAEEALAIGLCTEVGDVLEIGERLTDDLHKTAPLAVAAAKRAIDEGLDHSLTEGLAIERRCYESTLGTEDRKEGLAAFAEKRVPNFKGR
jgi:enoyl-CoA hydratase/carnithine racemase